MKVIKLDVDCSNQTLTINNMYIIFILLFIYEYNLVATVFTTTEGPYTHKIYILKQVYIKKE